MVMWAKRLDSSYEFAKKCYNSLAPYLMLNAINAIMVTHSKVIYKKLRNKWEREYPCQTQRETHKIMEEKIRRTKAGRLSTSSIWW